MISFYFRRVRAHTMRILNQLFSHFAVRQQQKLACSCFFSFIDGFLFFSLRNIRADSLWISFGLHFFVTLGIGRFAVIEFEIISWYSCWRIEPVTLDWSHNSGKFFFCFEFLFVLWKMQWHKQIGLVPIVYDNVWLICRVRAISLYTCKHSLSPLLFRRFVWLKNFYKTLRSN